MNTKIIFVVQLCYIFMAAIVVYSRKIYLFFLKGTRILVGNMIFLTEPRAVTFH